MPGTFISGVLTQDFTVQQRHGCWVCTLYHRTTDVVRFNKNLSMTEPYDCNKMEGLSRLHHNPFSSTQILLPPFPFYRHFSKELSLMQYLCADLHLRVSFPGNPTCNNGRSGPRKQMLIGGSAAATHPSGCSEDAGLRGRWLPPGDPLVYLWTSPSSL